MKYEVATTQPTKQLKTTLVGVVLLSVKPRKLIFGMQPYFNPTR
jgi:hypothetical protein